ncbi:MAG: WD40 repeat domain-containing protein [Acidobacteria bacterium]|nr:WD40 repeat domain-containing protein [Acidobacteriota bacterium]
MTSTLLTAITALAFSPDGASLYSSGYKEILVWSVPQSKLTRRIPGLSGRIRGLAVSPDNMTLAVAEGVPGRSGVVSLIDTATDARTVLADAPDEMLCVAFHPNGQLLAAGGTDNIVRIFQLATRQQTTKLEGHTGWITGVAFSPDGRLLATSSADGTVRIYDAATFKEILQIPQTPTDPISGLAFSPDNETLAFAVGGANEHSLRLWRVANAFATVDPTRPGQRNALMQTRPFDTGPCLPLAVIFTKLQNRPRPIAACADNTVAVLATNGGVTAKLAGHKDWVYTAATDKEASQFASGSGDGTIRIWNAQGRTLSTLTPEPAQ